MDKLSDQCAFLTERQATQSCAALRIMSCSIAVRVSLPVSARTLSLVAQCKIYTCVDLASDAVLKTAARHAKHEVVPRRRRADWMLGEPPHAMKRVCAVLISPPTLHSHNPRQHQIP